MNSGGFQTADSPVRRRRQPSDAWVTKEKFEYGTLRRTGEAQRPVDLKGGARMSSSPMDSSFGTAPVSTRPAPMSCIEPLKIDYFPFNLGCATDCTKMAMKVRSEKCSDKCGYDLFKFICL